MCIVVCALFLPQNSSVYRHLCSTKGYFDPWTNGGMKISPFLPVVIVEEAEKSWILNALLKDFILLFCIITHSSSSFKNLIIVPWKLLAIAWRGVVLFHSVYFPIQVVFMFQSNICLVCCNTVVTITFGTATQRLGLINFAEEQPR